MCFSSPRSPPTAIGDLRRIEGAVDPISPPPDSPTSGSASDSEESSEIDDVANDTEVENLFFRPLYAGPIVEDSEGDSEEVTSLIDEAPTEEEETDCSEGEDASDAEN
ncbi:hypothetical protein ACP4OV_027401 [Aristida adscensionis]